MSFTHNYDIEYLLEQPTTTEAQKRALQSLMKHQTVVKAAKALGINKRTLQATLHRCKKNAYSKDIDALVADGLSIKGTSTYYKTDEETGIKSERGQWIKTEKTHEDELEAIKTVTKMLADKVIGIKKKTKTPEKTNDELLTTYVTTDMHLGQYSWKDETGNDVDADIVFRNTLNASRLLNETTPNSRTAIVLDLGDTLHASNDAARTKSGHELDVDTRHAKIFKMLVELKIEMIDLALAKHEKVKYVIVPGNHSDLVCHYLIAMLQAYYKNETRLTVDDKSTVHKYHRHGKTLLGFHHGHATKLQRLPEVMVWDRKEDISNTNHRYWLTGHVHKDRVIDNPICRIESFRNLTNNDAWASAAGFRGIKQASAITYSDKYGEVARNIVNISQAEDMK